MPLMMVGVGGGEQWDPLQASAEGNSAQACWTINEMLPMWTQTWEQGGLLAYLQDVFLFRRPGTILMLSTSIHDTH